MIAATALIAEDEPLLAESLRAELARLWPGLRIVATVNHGQAAVEQALALRPEVLFLDIRMPGTSGLEAAQALAEDWPGAPDSAPFPLIVFVTAYDQYALQAFEQAAVDYLLKPVSPSAWHRPARACRPRCASVAARRARQHRHCRPRSSNCASCSMRRCSRRPDWQRPNGCA